MGRRKGADRRRGGGARAERVLEDEPEVVGKVGSSQRTAVVGDHSQQQSSVQPQSLQEARGNGGLLGVHARIHHRQVALHADVTKAWDDEARDPRDDVQGTADSEEEEEVEEEGETLAVHLQHGMIIINII